MMLSSPEIGLGEGGYVKIFIFVEEEWFSGWCDNSRPTGIFNNPPTRVTPLPKSSARKIR